MCGVVKYHLVLDREQTLALGCLLLFAACVQTCSVSDIAATMFSLDDIGLDEPRVKIKIVLCCAEHREVLIIINTTVDGMSLVLFTEGCIFLCHKKEEDASTCSKENTENFDKSDKHHGCNDPEMHFVSRSFTMVAFSSIRVTTFNASNGNQQHDLDDNKRQMLSRSVTMVACTCILLLKFECTTTGSLSSGNAYRTSIVMRNRRMTLDIPVHMYNVDVDMATGYKCSPRNVVTINLDDVSGDLKIIPLCTEVHNQHAEKRRTYTIKSKHAEIFNQFKSYLSKLTNQTRWRRTNSSRTKNYNFHYIIRCVKREGYISVSVYNVSYIHEMKAKRSYIKSHINKRCLNVNPLNANVDIYHRYNSNNLTYYIFLIIDFIYSQVSQMYIKHFQKTSSEVKAHFKTFRFPHNAQFCSKDNRRGGGSDKYLLLICMLVYILRNVINRGLNSKHSDISFSSLQYLVRYVVTFMKKIICNYIASLYKLLYSISLFNHRKYAEFKTHEDEEFYDFCFNERSKVKEYGNSMYHQLEAPEPYLERKCYRRKMLSFLYRLGDYQRPMFLQLYPVFKSVLNNHFENSLSDESYSSCNEIELIRVGTYSKFPAENKPWYLGLARAGFFYTGESDIVECFHCHVRHGNWSARDDPFGVHRRISPSCEFINGDSSLNIPVEREDEFSAKLPSLNGYSQTEQLPHYKQHGTTDPPNEAHTDYVKPKPSHHSSNNTDEKLSEHCKHRVLCKEKGPNHGLSASNTYHQQTNVVEGGPTCGLHHNIRHNGNNVKTTQTHNGMPNGHLYSLTVNGSQATPVTLNGSISTLQTNGHHERSNAEENRAELQNYVVNGMDRSEVQFPLRRGNQQYDQSNSPPMKQECQQSTGQSSPLNLPPLGIVSASPRYPKFAVVNIRASTFHGWPPTTGQSPRRLAEAGFIYGGYSDYVRCFFCGEGLSEWEHGDDPWVEHAKWFPHCFFLRQSKGDTFINLVHQRLQNPVTPNRNTIGQARMPLLEVPPIDTFTAPRNDTNPVNSPSTSVAIQSIEEMGYNRDIIDTAIAFLQSENKPTDAHNIMEVILSTPSVSSGELPTSERASIQPPAEAPYSQSSNDVTTSFSNQTSSTPSESSSFTLPSLSTYSNRSRGDEVAREHSAHALVNQKNDAASNVSSQLEKLSFSDIKSIVDENRSLKESRLCKICLDNEASIAFVPCGHLVCCAECAYAMRKCPICRQFVEGRIKTWIT